jgi:hypothetical protein
MASLYSSELLHCFELLLSGVAFQLFSLLPADYLSFLLSSASIRLVQILQLHARFQLALQPRILSAQLHLRFTLPVAGYLILQCLHQHLNTLFNSCSISSSFGLRLTFVQLPSNLAFDFVRYLIDYLGCPPSSISPGLVIDFQDYLTARLAPCLKI